MGVLYAQVPRCLALPCLSLPCPSHAAPYLALPRLFSSSSVRDAREKRVSRNRLVPRSRREVFRFFGFCSGGTRTGTDMQKALHGVFCRGVFSLDRGRHGVGGCVCVCNGAPQSLSNGRTQGYAGWRTGERATVRLCEVPVGLLGFWKSLGLWCRVTPVWALEAAHVSFQF